MNKDNNLKEITQETWEYMTSDEDFIEALKETLDKDEE